MSATLDILLGNGKSRPTLSTPWGMAQHVTHIADGITLVETASHGGIILSCDRHAAMPEPLRQFEPFAGARHYEEDCDWAVVVLAFPGEFVGRDGWGQPAIDAAERTVRDWKPELWAAWSAWKARVEVSA